MSTRLPRCVGHLWTLGLCLLTLACVGRHASLLLPGTPVPTPRPNLLRNADFLAGTDSWQMSPEDELGPLALAYDQAGFVALSLPPQPAPQRGGWSQTVAVEPRAAYYVSYRVHTEKLAGYADLHLTFHDPAGRLLCETGLLPAWGDTDWTTHAWRFRAPAGAAQATVSLGVEGATAGRAAFADPCLGPDDAPLTRALIVDYGQEVGRVRTYQQVNAGGGAPPAALAGLRTHGLAFPAAVQAIFPNPWADPQNPGSYDFEATDAALAALAQSGVEILFRLGEGYDGALVGAVRWAEVARRVVMHYNEGWADGYRHDIHYWEVWDDPEPHTAWRGSAEQHYDRLATTIVTLKAHNPELKVGGPALAPGPHAPYFEGLLHYLAEHGVRPDFFSWRGYHGGSPRAMAVRAAGLARLLDRYGFGDVEVIASDWGLPAASQPAGEAPAAAQAYAAAHLLASASYWQDTDLSRAYRSWSPEAPHLGLLDTGGEPTLVGQAFRLLGELERTPQRLLTQGGDDLGFTLLAGKSDDGRLVQVLIADTGSRSEGYRLGLGGFPQGFCYLVSEISPGCPGEVIVEGQGADLQDGLLALPWRSPAAHLIQFSWP